MFEIPLYARVVGVSYKDMVFFKPAMIKGSSVLKSASISFRISISKSSCGLL